MLNPYYVHRCIDKGFTSWSQHGQFINPCHIEPGTVQIPANYGRRPTVPGHDFAIFVTIGEVKQCCLVDPIAWGKGTHLCM